MSGRESDIRVLGELKDTLHQIRLVLDELARSDARNTTQISNLYNWVSALEKRIEKRLDTLENLMASSQRARWELAGGRAALWKLLTAIGVSVGVAGGLAKLFGVV